ncbi:lipopolysaccharide core heptosyltransferase RfaQ [Citrobacter freundii]|nr:lipopolysaccharide core heptosyltransferase RfaQ [Citrobacter freundii]QLY50318.1 lipopolysaccharide core heptosyltransferase RfaQ [Citrobacter freundii]
MKKILVIKMRFHGDMLLTTPVISTLKANYPNADIDVLLYEDTFPILSENPDIHELYGIKNKKNPTFEKIKNFLALIKVLRSNHYDLVVNLTDQWIVAVICRCLGCPIKLTHDFAHRNKRFWRNSFTHHVALNGEHWVERNLSVLAPLNLKELHPVLTMVYGEQVWQSVRSKLPQVDTNKYVVIQPTARQDFKSWENDRFSQVIDAIHLLGYQVVLTSGPGASDLLCIDDIAKRCKTKPLTEVAGQTTFPELAALIEHAVLFIGVDSAPMHIAAAVKTPIICLFGATDHIAWRPWSDNVIQFWAGDYQSMPVREKLDRSKKYLAAIPAQDVIVAVESMLPKLDQ